MKLPIIQALSIYIVLLGCNAASANEAQEFLKYFSWWEGEWEVETKVGDEIQMANMTIERHEPGCHTVKGDGISLWGYDPQLKTWVGTGFMADGSRFTDVLQRPANEAIQPGAVDKSRIESWQADGTKAIAESTWSYEDEDTAVIRQIRKTASGDELPTIVITFKRKEVPPASAQEWLEFFVGRWEVQERLRTYPVDGSPDDADWDSYPTVTDWKAVPDVAAITVVREVPHASTSTLGWDPAKKALVQTGYLGNGSCFRIEFWEIDETVIKGSVTISFSSGETGKGSFTVTRNGDNEYRTEWKAMATDDMVLEGSATFTR